MGTMSKKRIYEPKKVNVLKLKSYLIKKEKKNV